MHLLCGKERTDIYISLVKSSEFYIWCSPFFFFLTYGVDDFARIVAEKRRKDIDKYRLRVDVTVLMDPFFILLSYRR